MPVQNSREERPGFERFKTSLKAIHFSILQKSAVVTLLHPFNVKPSVSTSNGTQGKNFSAFEHKILFH
jgi:hypothetical protein